MFSLIRGTPYLIIENEVRSLRIMMSPELRPRYAYAVSKFEEIAFPLETSGKRSGCSIDSIWADEKHLYSSFFSDII